MNNINESNLQIMDNFYSAREQDITKFATDPEIIKLVRDKLVCAKSIFGSLYCKFQNYYGELLFSHSTRIIR